MVVTPEALDNVYEQLVQGCTRRCSGWDLNPRPFSRKSNALTTAPPSHRNSYSGAFGQKSDPVIRSGTSITYETDAFHCQVTFMRLMYKTAVTYFLTSGTILDPQNSNRLHIYTDHGT